MRRLIEIVVCVLVLPFTLLAQETLFGGGEGQDQQQIVLLGDSIVSEVALLSTPITSGNQPADSSTLQERVPSPPKARPVKPSTNAEGARPLIAGSMVGYIDNAIVGSEIRVRFDDGFDNNRPDRAEFFYAQCGCDGGTAAGPKPGLATHLNFQQLYLRAEYAPVSRFSFYVELPFRWLQPQQFAPGTIPAGQNGFPNHSGISDFQAGFKFALLASHQHYLTFQFGAAFPSGDSSRGLGTNHYSIAPSLLYFQRLNERLSIEGQLGDSHPLSGATPGFPGDVFTYGIGPSYVVYQGEKVRVAPVVELVGWKVFGGMENSADSLFQTGVPVVSSDGTNIVNLKVGARTAFGAHHSFYLGFGQALTHQIWYKHLVRLEYRYSF